MPCERQIRKEVKKCLAKIAIEIPREIIHATRMTPEGTAEGTGHLVNPQFYLLIC